MKKFLTIFVFTFIVSSIINKVFAAASPYNEGLFVSPSGMCNY